MLEVTGREDGEVALHLPIGPLKTSSELESLPRCKPNIYQPISG